MRHGDRVLPAAVAAKQHRRQARVPTLHARLLRPLQRPLKDAFEAAEHGGADGTHPLQHAVAHVGDAALLLGLWLLPPATAGWASQRPGSTAWNWAGCSRADGSSRADARERRANKGSGHAPRPHPAPLDGPASLATAALSAPSARDVPPTSPKLRMRDRPTLQAGKAGHTGGQQVSN